MRLPLLQKVMVLIVLVVICPHCCYRLIVVVVISLLLFLSVLIVIVISGQYDYDRFTITQHSHTLTYLLNHLEHTALYTPTMSLS